MGQGTVLIATVSSYLAIRINRIKVIHLSPASHKNHVGKILIFEGL